MFSWCKGENILAELEFILSWKSLKSLLKKQQQQDKAEQKNTCNAVELNRDAWSLTAVYDPPKNNSTTFMGSLMASLILDLIGCVFPALIGHLLGLI